MAGSSTSKHNKGWILALVVLILIAGTFFLPVGTGVKFIAAAAVVLAYLYMRRGFILFIKGARLLKKNESEKAWSYLQKAIKAGIYPDQEVLIGSGYIQQGDVEIGMQILENVKSKCDITEVLQTLSVTKSMGYWRQGKLDEAVDEIETLFNSGFVDNNLLINITTYLLQKEDLKKAKKYLAECKKHTKVLTTGMEDNQGWYYMLSGDMDKARKTFSELINDRKPKFPEAYVHGAQVSVYFNRLGEAVERLEQASSKRFTYTCTYKEEYIQSLINGITNPELSADFINAMKDNMVAVALGNDFDGLEKGAEFENEGLTFETDEKEVFNKEVNIKKEKDVEKKKEVEGDGRIPDTTPDDDEKEPNTDL